MWLRKAEPGAVARGRDHGRAGVRGGEKASEEAGPLSTCPLLVPSPVKRTPSPSKPGTTNLRAKGKLTADAAEKFRGLSRGLLPAEKEARGN